MYHMAMRTIYCSSDMYDMGVTEQFIVNVFLFYINADNVETMYM